MNSFQAYLHGIVPLTEDVVQAIDEITIFRTLQKGTFLIRNGEICTEFHYISTGIARVFYYKDGKEVTAWFASAGNIVSAIDSLFTHTPSIYNIELLEDAEIYSLQYQKIEPVFQAHPIVERLGRLLITHNYLLLDERMKLFAFCNAEERYAKLIEQIPTILQSVKLGHIASYLGVSQEHLSRIRAIRLK